MVQLMFEPDRAKLAKEKLVGIYDPACGTGGMLTIAKEYLLGGINPALEVYLYDQELNEKTYAIAKADVLKNYRNHIGAIWYFIHHYNRTLSVAT